MKEKIKNFVKNITPRQLIIFIILTFILDKILYYWLGDLLINVFPLSPLEALSLHEFISNIGIILEFSYIIAFIWLIIISLKNLGKKDYERKN